MAASAPDHMARWATTGTLAAALVRCADTATTIGRQHGLQGEPLAVLAHAITASLLMATRLKGPGVLTMQLQTNGVFSHLRCDAIGLGSVRAMVVQSVAEALQAWNGVDPLLGAGQIEVAKQLAADVRPYRSSIALDRSDPAWAANRYLATSEQVDACLMTDARVDGDRVIEATGCYLERLPNAEDDHPELEHLRRHQASVDAGHLPGLSGDHNDRGLLERIIPGSELVHLQDYPVGFHCPCSAERYIATLRGMPNDQITDLATNGIIEATCDFCRTTYPIPLDEVL